MCFERGYKKTQKVPFQQKHFYVAFINGGLIACKMVAYFSQLEKSCFLTGEQGPTLGTRLSCSISSKVLTVPFSVEGSMW